MDIKLEINENGCFTTIDGTKAKISDMWWEGDDFCFVTETKVKYRLESAYLSAFNFDGLDTPPNEEVEIVWRHKNEYF